MAASFLIGVDYRPKEEERPAQSITHRRDSGREGENLYISRHLHQRGPLLVSQHPAHCQEVSAAAVLLKKAEEIWTVHQTPQQLLQVYSGEPPAQLHHSVVWELYRKGRLSNVGLKLHNTSVEQPSHHFRIFNNNNNTFNLEAPFKTPKVTLQSIWSS